MSLKVKQYARFIPFSSYFMELSHYQMVSVDIATHFDNSKFPVRKIDLEVDHGQILFSEAVLKVKTSLNGARFFMREFFYSTAAFFIGALTILTILSSITTFFCLRYKLLSSYEKREEERRKRKEKKEKQKKERLKKREE